ncbi:hypothetical protein RYX36_014782, partial [Vicia faba]
VDSSFAQPYFSGPHSRRYSLRHQHPSFNSSVRYDVQTTHPVSEHLPFTYCHTLSSSTTPSVHKPNTIICSASYVRSNSVPSVTQPQVTFRSSAQPPIQPLTRH